MTDFCTVLSPGLFFLNCGKIFKVVSPLAPLLLSVHSYPIGISKSTQLLKLTLPAKKLKVPPGIRRNRDIYNVFIMLKKVPNVNFELHLVTIIEFSL